MKRNNFRPISRTNLVACTLIASAFIIRGADFESNLEKTFPTAPGGTLVVQADRGSCEIAPADGSEVRIRVLRQVKGGDKRQADELFANHEVTFDTSGSTVSVIGKTARKLPFVGTPHPPYLMVRFQIDIPKKFGVDVRTSGGDVRIGDVDGKVKAHTSSGTITLGQVSGGVMAENSGGDIAIGEASAETEAQTSSGAIRIKKVKGKTHLSNSGGDIRVGEAQSSLFAKTSSGRIDIQSVGGDLEAQDSGGDIKVGAANGTVTAATSSGSISLGHIKSGAVNVKDSGGDISIDSADGNVTAKTSSGSIKIRTAKGMVTAQNSGGDIHIGETGGQVTATTSSGSIVLKRVNGKLTARDSGGDIRLEQAAGAVHASTSSGNIVVGFVSLPSDECRFEVSGGGITLTVPKWAAFDVDAVSQGGSVHTDLPVARVHGRTALRGAMNQGGPKLFLRSSSGDIQIKASNLANPKPEAESK